ncbi:MAG: cupin domain-containing protein [Methylobacteriaceae bacterium]|nr:cupin domain-containing protein [Methylobacteriaceae bacterium]
MNPFATLALDAAPLFTAPDGSDVRPLLALPGGSLAHFALAAGKTSIAVAHRSVEEIWFVTGGRGEMWRKQGEREEIVALAPGLSLTIPLATEFQFRSFGPEALTIVAVTMPPWPGEGEACLVEGKWPASV